MNGDIVGSSTFFYDGGADGPSHAVFWPVHTIQPFTMTSAFANRTMLPVFADGDAGEPRAVNVCGTIAGEVSTPGYHHAVIWSKLLCDS